MRDYCVDLELARELEKNKFPYKSDGFEYEVIQFTGGGQDLVYLNYHGAGRLGLNVNCVEQVYAPTTDELLNELPSEIMFNNENTLNGECHSLTIIKAITYYTVGYNYYEHDEKLANALAKLWLHYKKENKQ